MNIAFDGNTEHCDNGIDLAGSEGIVVSVMVTTAPTSTTAPAMAPACEGIPNRTHAPTSEDSSGGTSGFVIDC